MTYNLRLRRTILHLEQRLRIDGDTFIQKTPLSFRTARQIFNYIFTYRIRLEIAHIQGNVRISGPCSVIATECSKCAVNLPSRELTVHSLGITRV